MIGWLFWSSYALLVFSLLLGIHAEIKHNINKACEAHLKGLNITEE